jgi:predicted DNA-binding protein (MmcQ/YjbR family)
MPSSPRAALLSYALSHPDAWEDHPWGETVAKVGKKIFVAFGVPRRGFSVTAKLPVTYPTALAQPYAEPTGYGLGPSGWVTATFEPGAKVPLALMKAWIDESYRAIAPKKLAAQVAAGGRPAGRGAAAVKPGARRTATSRSPRRRDPPRRSRARPPTSPAA